MLCIWMKSISDYIWIWCHDSYSFWILFRWGINVPSFIISHILHMRNRCYGGGAFLPPPLPPESVSNPEKAHPEKGNSLSLTISSVNKILPGWVCRQFKISFNYSYFNIFLYEISVMLFCLCFQTIQLINLCLVFTPHNYFLRLETSWNKSYFSSCFLSRLKRKVFVLSQCSM